MLDTIIHLLILLYVSGAVIDFVMTASRVFTWKAFIDRCVERGDYNDSEIIPSRIEFLLSVMLSSTFAWVYVIRDYGFKFFCVQRSPYFIYRYYVLGMHNMFNEED